jgi:PemK-like, MazF-like toxin of type II toxin-antitoxin system
LVINYGYLWLAEYQQGREEGVKDRPCAVVLAVKNDKDETVVTVVPVTHVAPANSEDAVEIPTMTKQRLRLDADRSWIVVTEINRFVWPGADVRPVSRAEPERFDYGFLPPSLFRQVKERLGARAAARRLQSVQRTE